ncbi:3-ketoacyl-ACP reductase [Alteromonas sp. V450]|uniref:SDR family oxidoreductase n=1 Tax=Alteromonas sp. V450 TaxID=1912139 RepID=UPI0008FF54E3|nr:SDR family oxidoreductase [Alteromonas sp. V450]OJF67484.1 3-ketoacyl-ACP reductase [Alteromonas sp. V450]
MTDTYALAGKTAIVTGGGKGLGKTLARFLLEAGMNVAICGRTETAVKQTIKQFDVLFPGNIIGQVCDVSKSADVASFVRKVKDTFGELHVLINNSGFGKETLIWETSEEDWDEVMDTNVKGAFLLCKEVVPHMINNKEGYIINIASQAALNGYANAGVYCASKFAMVGLGKALQEEVRPYGIHVHSLNPALIQSQKAETEKVDNGLIQNEDLGNMVVYLLSQPRRLKIDNIGLWGY